MIIVVLVIVNIIVKLSVGIVDDLIIFILFVIIILKFVVFVMNVNMYNNLCIKYNMKVLS